MMKNKIIVQDINIKINQYHQEDFISTGDISNNYILQNQIRTKDITELLDLWDK